MNFIIEILFSLRHKEQLIFEEAEEAKLCTKSHCYR
jgi:hypothetical protein